MDTNLKANAVILRLRKLHKATRELGESYQNVSSNSSQRGSASRIRKTSSNGKNLQPQTPSTIKPDDLLKTSKRNKKDIDINSDSNSYEQRVETKQKSYQPKKNIIGYNEMPNQRPPFSNAKKNLISTIEDTTKQSNQRPPFSNARKNQINIIDEPNKQSNQRTSISNSRKNQINNFDEPNQKPPFSAGKVNYSAAANDSSKQKTKLTNRTVKSTNNNLTNKKSELKKQDQPIRKQSLSKKNEQPTKTEISASTGNKNYVSKRKISTSNIETDQNPPKQLTDVEKATKEVERNPKSSRFINSRINNNNNNDEIPSYDFKAKQNDAIQNISINRSDKINEAYKKVPQARTIITSNGSDDDSKSDEVLKEVAAFLKRKKQVSLNSTILQNTSSPVKKNPVSRVQKNKPFSWGNALKSISNDDDSNKIRNKNSNSSAIKANDSNYKMQNQNNVYNDDSIESDELNLFFTPEKDFSKRKINNNTRISNYNSNLKATLLDESDSASLGSNNPMQNDVYLSTESETEIVPDSLTRKSTNDYKPKDQFVNIMQKKLAKVLNSDSTELSASSDIGQTEINKLTTISNRNNRILYSDSIKSDESEDLLNQPQQQFSVIKNPNSKISSISKYGKVSSSNLSRFAQNNTQKALSSDADDYLSSDSKSEEIFSITERRKEDTNIIKSRNAKYNQNKNQDKLTVEQIKNNYLDSATDNSSTKSVEYEEFPDLIISNKSPKKAIKDYNIVKNQVLNDIQSSDSSSPEVLKFYSKNNLSSRKTTKDDQKNSFDQFDASRFSSIVLSEFEESSNIINGDKNGEISSNTGSQIKSINKNQFKQLKNSISDDDDDDEIPEVKQTPKPIENISANNKQKNVIIQEDDEENDNDILVIKKPPQLETQVVAASNIIQKKKLNSIFLNDEEEEEDDDDDEIPAVKKPPQPEPQITTGIKSLNKGDVDQQEMSDVIDDEYPDEIPMPNFGNLNNKNKEIDDLDSNSVENNSKIEKKKSSPLRVSPPIGITYFSKVNKNEEFQPLKFDENDEIKENSVSIDKEQKSDDEKIEITQNNENHSSENDSNEEFIDDSLDEKIKMARNTISKIKGNQQQGQKSFNLFGSNSFEEEEEILENYNLIEEEEEEQVENVVDIKKEEKKIQPNKQEKKQLRSNLIDDDLNENQIESNSKKGKKEFHINNYDDIDDDDEILNANQFKPSDVKTTNNLNSQFKADVINNESEKSDYSKQSKFTKVFNIEEDYDDDDDENESLDTNKFKSSSAKTNNYLDDRFKIDINDETKSSNNTKQSKFKNTVSDDEDEDENELLKLGNNKKIESDKVNNSIKLENDSNNSSDDAQFIFESISKEEQKVENQNEFESKKENGFENEEVNNDNKEKDDVFSKKYIGSNNENDNNQLIKLTSKNKNEEEEEINNDIVINPKIEMEEDEEEEAPIDPYFLDNNISDDSDVNENHDTIEKTTKKLDSQNESSLEKKQNQDINEDDDMNYFENLKRNFLKQDSEDENEEEEKQIINVTNTTNNEQTQEEIVNKIVNEEEQNENEIDKNINYEDDDDDEEEDQILQKLKDYYSQNKSSLDNYDQISSLINTKTKDTQDSNKSNSHNFLQFLEIEEEEEEEDNNDISLSEKISNLMNIPIDDEEEEEEIKENLDENNITIKIPAIKDVQNMAQINKSGNSASKIDADYSNLSNNESALDFLNQEDFLEDRLFLAKNKNINNNNEKVSQKDNKEEEEENNDDIQNDVPENNKQSESLSNQLIKKVDSLIEGQNSENEEEEEEENYVNQISKSNKKVELITKVSPIKKKLEDENKDINQMNATDLSQNNEVKYSSTPNDIEEEIKNKLQKSNETNLNDQNAKVEYEYEYEEEENLEQITISNNEYVTKIVTNNSQNESKKETQKQNESEKSKQQNELNYLNNKNLKNENVEYEYEYEEEIIEKTQETLIETENTNKLNQPQIEIKKEENNKKDTEIPNNVPKAQNVEYEYEYEEESNEQPHKIADNKAKKEENKNENDEEESFDEEAIIQRLQNFECLDFNKDFEKNLKNDIDLNEEEEEEEEIISDDSLIKRLDHGISLMENEENDENDDENIDSDTIQKRMQDLLNIEISDDESEGDDENFNLEKKDD